MYEVSNLGNVRSWHARGNKELADEPTILSTYSDEQGYKRITLAVSEAPGKRYSAYVHRLIAEAFVGPVEGMKVRHLNDIKSDNRLENLALGTHEDNMADMKANGNHTWNRKLTFEQAEEIRQRFADGETIKAIHQDFPDVTYVAMRAVANGRRYQTEERHYGPTGDAA